MSDALASLLSFDDECIAKQVRQAGTRLNSKFGPPRLSGRHRVVFEGRGFVYKLPRNEMGLLDNPRESRRYREGNFPYPMARCRLLHISDIPVLVMQKVDVSLGPRELPEWAGFIDCFQVGVSPRQEFLAYDYA